MIGAGDETTGTADCDGLLGGRVGVFLTECTGGAETPPEIWDVVLARRMLRVSYLGIMSTKLTCEESFNLILKNFWGCQFRHIVVLELEVTNWTSDVIPYVALEG